jgi:hypothetical protein
MFMFGNVTAGGKARQCKSTTLDGFIIVCTIGVPDQIKVLADACRLSALK